MKLLTELDKIELKNEFRISKGKSEPAGSLQIQPSDTPTDDLSSLDYRIGAKKDSDVT